MRGIPCTTDICTGGCINVVQPGSCLIGGVYYKDSSSHDTLFRT